MYHITPYESVPTKHVTASSCQSNSKFSRAAAVAIDTGQQNIMRNFLTCDRLLFPFGGDLTFGFESVKIMATLAKCSPMSAAGGLM